MTILDRRLNPKSKSLGNRQRFMRRSKASIQEAIRETVKQRKIADVEGGEKIKIRTKSLREPSFVYGRNSGRRDFVLPGNESYQQGDEIPKPKGGAGSGGNEGSADGEGEDEFVFMLSREEFMDIFFEELKLPNLIKAKLKSMRSPLPVRAGYSIDGPPSRLNHVRTMRNSLARRIALSRPTFKEMRQLEDKIVDADEDADHDRALHFRQEAERRAFLMKKIAYIDPLDVRYNRYDRVPQPMTQAVMFCLMDASASMTEELKDLAKRFYILLHLFLTRHYNAVDIVFIRHTSTATEVDEDTFFYGRESGGTVVSSAFEEMKKIVAERYPVEDWNIYAAQASDGHNFLDDMPRTLSHLTDDILSICQYFAYIEVGRHSVGFTETDSPLWQGYQALDEVQEHFAMRRVKDQSEIFPVFHDLFSGAKTAT